MSTTPPEGHDYAYKDEGWELHEEPGRERYYTFDGKRNIAGRRIVSVTTALKIIDKSDVLTYWATQQTIRGVCDLLDSPPTRKRYTPTQLNMALRASGAHPEAALKAGGTKGTDEHLALERWVMTGVLPPPSNPMMSGFRRSLAGWLRDTEPRVLASELAVGSVKHAYAGTFDLLYETDDGLVLADVKTSKRMYPGSHFRQLGAYEMARREMGMRPATAACVILLRQDGPAVVHWMHEFCDLTLEGWGARFRSALWLYREEAAIEALKRKYERDSGR